MDHFGDRLDEKFHFTDGSELRADAAADAANAAAAGCNGQSPAGNEPCNGRTDGTATGCCSSCNDAVSDIQLIYFYLICQLTIAQLDLLVDETTIQREMLEKLFRC